MIFTFETDDARRLAGIAAARLAYNDANPDAPFETDADYLQFVFDRAAESYATQYGA